MVHLVEIDGYRICADCVELLDLDAKLDAALASLAERDPAKAGVQGVLRAHIWTRVAKVLQNPEAPVGIVVEKRNRVQFELESALR